MLFEDFRQERKQIEDEQELDRPLAEDAQSEGDLLGLTPAQRFFVAFLLMMMILILGVLFLLVSSKIVPPFLG